MGTGDKLEALVRRSVKAQEMQGLRLNQTGARFVGKVGKNGKAKGRIVSKGELDFTGHLTGRYVTFDAKSTAIATSFPLKMLKKHQVKILEHRHEEGAIAFFLVEFARVDGGPRYFALTWPELRSFWVRFEWEGAPASIPFVFFLGHCVEVKCEGRTLDLTQGIQDFIASKRELR